MKYFGVWATFPRCPKMLQARAKSQHALALWVDLRAYVCEHETGGKVDAAALLASPVPQNARKAAVRALVDARLLDVVDGGWMVHDYGDHATELAAIEAQTGPEPAAANETPQERKRRLARNRQWARRHAARDSERDERDRSRDGPRDCHAPESVTERDTQRDSERDKRDVSRPPPHTPSPSDLDSDRDRERYAAAEDPTGFARTYDSAPGVQSARIPCPSDLDLTDDERANLIMGGVPEWAIVRLVPLIRARFTSQDARTPEQWRRSLVRAVAGDWNDPKKRPRRLEAVDHDPAAERRRMIAEADAKLARFEGGS